MKVSGCTVHFVDETLDGGPIIAQRAVPVIEGDTVDSLSARILEQEHQLYAEAVARVLTRQVVDRIYKIFQDSHDFKSCES